MAPVKNVMNYGNHMRLKFWQKNTEETNGRFSYIDSFNNYAENIAQEVISNFNKDRNDSDEGFVFAISAKWGAGKTFLLDLIKPHLREAGFKYVTFNAWQYTQDANTLRRAFLKKLHKELGYANYFKPIKLKEVFLKLFRPIRLTSLDHEETRTNLWLPPLGYLIGTLFVLVIIVLIDPSGIVGHTANFLKDLPGLVQKNSAFTTLLVVALSFIAVPSVLHIQRKSSKISSVDDFEDLFDRLTKKHPKLVIFIDDLDRCTPEGAKLVLDSLKTFFVRKNVSYIVTGDHTVLERYMGKQVGVAPVYDENGQIDKEKTDDLERYEGQRFMQKIFNVYWKLPQLEPAENEELVDVYLSKVKVADDQRDHIKVLLLAFLDKTPREIKRFTKLLDFSLKMIRARSKNKTKSGKSKQIRENLEKVSNNSALLAKILLLQEKFNPMFNVLSENPDEYIAIERNVLKNKADAVKSRYEKFLGRDFDKFITFARTSPTFHNASGTVLHISPAIFFYYSGFTGGDKQGIISEDFISRYMTEDDKLVADFLNVRPREDRISIFDNAVADMPSIKEHATRVTAMENMLDIMEKEGNPYQQQFPRLIGAYTNTMTIGADTAKDHIHILERIFRLARKHINLDVIDKITDDKAWDNFLQKLWDHVDFSSDNAAIIERLIARARRDGVGSADFQTVQRQFFEQNMNVIYESGTSKRSADAVKTACQRLIDYVDKLELRGLFTTDVFDNITSALYKLSPKNQKAKVATLLDFVNEKNPVWRDTGASNKIDLYKRKNGVLRKKYGNRAITVYNSWLSDSK